MMPPGRYIEGVKSTFPKGLRLDGLKIVVDCANGAAYRVAPTALWELGANVIPIGVSPDGFNINRGCGSTVPDQICAAVVEHGADLGIALDGDADRLILADEHGEIIDGDQILALIARSWANTDRAHRQRDRGHGHVQPRAADIPARPRPRPASHPGRRPLCRRADASARDQPRRRAVRPRRPLRFLDDRGMGWSRALQVLAVLVRQGAPASEVCRVFKPSPQLLRNVRFSGPSPLGDARVKAAIAAAEAALGPEGRLLIRPSGTEPLIRVMAEAEDDALIARIVGEVCEVIAAVARTPETAA